VSFRVSDIGCILAASGGRAPAEGPEGEAQSGEEAAAEESGRAVEEVDGDRTGREGGGEEGTGGLGGSDPSACREEPAAAALVAARLKEPAGGAGPPSRYPGAKAVGVRSLDIEGWPSRHRESGERVRDLAEHRGRVPESGRKRRGAFPLGCEE